MAIDTNAAGIAFGGGIYYRLKALRKKYPNHRAWLVLRMLIVFGIIGGASRSG